MLRSLHIRNYVLIESLDVDFPAGLSIISGPTGAGKSILIGALGLLTGAKADASVISPGAENCMVEGEFLFDDEAVGKLCEDNDLEYDAGHIIIRRTVSSSGRSRSFVNDSPVPLAVLHSFGELLVDIHSQHETLLLTSKAVQLSALDSYAGNGELLRRCFETFSAYRDAVKKVAELKERIAKAEGENDYNAAVYEQLRSAGLREGEIAELEAEQHSLANAEQIRELLDSSLEILEPSSAEGGLNSGMSGLARALEKLRDFIPDMKDLASRAEAVRIELKDISAELAGKSDSAVADPSRLQWVDDRLSLLYGLLKRHSCSTEGELIARRDELAALVSDGGDLAGQLAGEERRLAGLEHELSSICDSLHESRVRAAGTFSEEILSGLAYVELENATFKVALNTVAPGPSGRDEAEFLFSASGTNPVAVAKCASGGELSRIMLALKSLMSRHMNMPTMVFDEIDTGVSGSVADRMGSVICDMGARMQVFAITHLPQVAAKGEAHYLVGKSVAEGRASSTVSKLSEEERVLEIARMLSGSTLTPEAVANARALLARTTE